MRFFASLFILLSVSTAQVDYNTDIQPIFDNSCTNCHRYGNTSGGLNLESYGMLMSGNTVVAGDHASSVLWQRVSNGSMPPGANDLSTTQVSLIAQWIDEGALEAPAVDYSGPVWHVAITGSDETGDGSESNPYATIQKGLDLAQNSDTVLVHPGIYHEQLTMGSHSGHYYRDSIHVISSSGPENTIIDGDMNGVVVRELAINMHIEGFTITGGSAYNDYNLGWQHGAIGVWGSEYFRVETITIKNVVFQGNDIAINFGFGNGHQGNSNLDGLLSATISNCTFIIDSDAYPGLRIDDQYGGSYSFSNSIFYSSLDNNYFQIAGTGNLISLNNSIVSPDVNIPESFFNSGQNTMQNPLFCDAENGDFTVASNSPAIGSGDNDSNIGALGVGCDATYNGPLWYIATTGSDETGDGSENNPFATIQKGISSSVDNDTVLVSSGVYIENINYNGKNIAVIGENRETTIIDGNQNGNVVTFENGENINSLLRNFTVKNSGYPGDWGGGIFINWGSTPSLDSLIIIDNTGGGYGGSYGGGGICVIRTGSKANLTNSIISNNFGDSENGGLFACWQGEIVATNCIITGNHTGAASSCASGPADTNIELINCTIVDNVYTGVYAAGSVSINSSIIYNNGYNESDSNINDANVGGTLSVVNSLVEYGFEGEGNIDVDPLFCDPENGDYSLSENSPAVGSGYNGSNMGALPIGCTAEYIGPVWHIATTGSDETGDGSNDNPFSTIQKGIDSAVDDDTVLVASGTYIENIDYSSKKLVIASHFLSSNGDDDFISNTIIDGDSTASCVTMIGSSSELIGFTLTNGYSNDEMKGSAVTIQGESNISYCLLVNNYSYGSAPIIIAGENNSSSFNHLTIYDNYGYDNGGMVLNDGNWPNAIIGNGCCWNADEFTISNSIFGFFEYYGGYSPNVNYSNNYSFMEVSWSSFFPSFCDPANGDYALAANSPCVSTVLNGEDIGAFGVGCEALYLPPVIDDIADQQTNEDTPLMVSVSASSQMGSTLTYFAETDTSAMPVYMDGSSVAIGLQANWNGVGTVTVIVSDDNGLSDTTSFQVTVTPVNDPPENFSILYPTLSDTFTTHTNANATIPFIWEKSNDIDSDVTYKLTVVLEFFGNTYTDSHENITDTTFSISAPTLDALLNATGQDIAELSYTIEASDEEFIISSNTTGNFMLTRTFLSTFDNNLIPKAFTLHQNYPNPFNPTTQIQYDLPESKFVSIDIYDVMGRKIKSLVNSVQDAGYRSVYWDATNNLGQSVSAGMYIYTIIAGDLVQTKKMVLMK